MGVDAAHEGTISSKEVDNAVNIFESGKGMTR